MTAGPTTIDEYLSALSDDKRAALEKLRQTIRSVVPDAEECLSYRLPAFRRNGPLVAFGATGNHCAFYLMSSTTVEAHEEELAGYDTSKGTIRFQADRPLPAALVRKLVKARIAENDGLAAKKARAGSRGGVAKGATASAATDPAVDAFMVELEHPLKREIEEARRIILGAAPGIGEAIKWKAPSFRTTEFFATFNLRSRDIVQLVFHLGAKVRKDGVAVEIADPEELITWVAKDRCLVTLGAGRNIKARRKALEGIVREWIRHI
jgi:uncharacterized protein YdhG (YjbR/CyaY superfamily)